MNIEKLARQALDKIKEIVELPEKGVIAGGSLANIMWEIVSGNKAIINDVDIFEFKQEISLEEYQQLKKHHVTPGKNFYESNSIKYIETYDGLTFRKSLDEFYYIIETYQVGLINKIDVGGTNNDPMTIIRSFDINCTQIAYSIEESKFYYTDEFIEFLQTGNLKITNLTSPSHTAIRLLKKQKDLNAKLDEIELKACAFSIHKHYTDINRRYFTMKYAMIFAEHSKRLLNYFTIRKDEQMKQFIFRNKEKQEIFYLTTYGLEESINFNDFDDLKLTTTEQLLTYIRKFNHIDKKLFSDLKLIISVDDYFDIEVDKNQVEFLNKIIQTAPDSIEQLRGYRLSEQLGYIEKLISRYSEKDRYIAICVLEHPNFKLDKVEEYSKYDMLLFELNKRRRITESKDKKNVKIFGIGNPNKKQVECSDDFWDF